VLSYSANSYAIYKMKNGFMLQPTVTAGSDNARLTREQGMAPNETVLIDSLSPDFSRTYNYVKPELKLRRGTQKVQLGIGLAYEAGWLQAKLSGGTPYPVRSFGYLVPSFNWLNEYSIGRRIQFNYSSNVNEPSVDRMLPVANITSPLSRFTGNVNLRPEYIHNTHLSWVWFDQFSFTSFFSYLSFRYTHDKINIARTINADLSQHTTVVNVPDDYQLRGSASFGRPIRPLGITYNIGINETYERGINLVNGISNKTDVLTHELKLSLGNRKKEKWDVQIGGIGRMTDAKYSVHHNLNNRFYNLTGFSEISYRPSDKWYFLATADVTQYTAQSFSGAVVIPLLKAEASYYFMKANRGTLTLEAFDLLNQNKGLERVSELNFLRETRSNTIGQYFMLSFKYRLSKAATDNPRGGMILRSHR
jgi:hypothetical protein